jgi:hypothetical protein
MHISQNPPPPGAILKDIVDYTSHPKEQTQAIQVPEKKPKKIEPDKIEVESGEVLEPEIYYEDDSDTGGSRRKLRKKIRMENGKNGQEDDSPDETLLIKKNEHRSNRSRR